MTDELLLRGQAVRALVRDAGKAAALRERGVEVVVGDICDRSILDRAVQGMDTIYHCAAAVGAEHTRDVIYRANREGVRHLLDAVRQAGAGRVVLLSSVNVLGTCDLERATEDLPCRPSNDPAADVKIEAEQLALEAHRRQGLNIVILRPGFIYGSGDDRNLPKLAEAVRKGRFRYFGSRDNIVPIVHVSDVVRAMLRAAETPAAVGRVYHITDGSRTTIGELVGLLAEVQGVPPPEQVLPLGVARLLCSLGQWMGRLGLRRRRAPLISPATLRFLGTSRWVDISRARQELGYEPQVSIREGVPATLGRSEGPCRGQSNFAESSA
jgi:nucleoside-diphosphate-sugar epimerase